MRHLRFNIKNMRVFGIPNPAFLPSVNESSVVTNGLVTCFDTENPKCFANNLSWSVEFGPSNVTNLAYSTGIPIDSQQIGTTGTYYIEVYAYILASDNTTKVFSSGTVGYFNYSFGSSTYFTHYVSYTGVSGVDGYYIYVYTDTPYGSNYDFYVDNTVTSFYVDYANVYADDGYNTFLTTYGNNNPPLITLFSSGYGSLKDLTSNKEDWDIFNYGEYSNEKNGIIKLVADYNSYIRCRNNLSPYYGTSSQVSIAMWYNPNAQGQILSELGSPNINTGWHDAQIDLKNSGSAGSGSFYMTTWDGYASSQYRTTDPLPYNEWYHLAFVHDSGSFFAYLNGNLFGSSSFTRLPPYTNGYDLYYAIAAIDGTNPESTTGLYSSGSLGSIYVYNRALSSNEIFQNYNSTKNRFIL